MTSGSDKTVKTSTKDRLTCIEQGDAIGERRGQNVSLHRKSFGDVFSDEYIQEQLEQSGETTLSEGILIETVAESSTDSAPSPISSPVSLPGAYSVLPGVTSMFRRTQSRGSSAYVAPPMLEDLSSLGLDSATHSDSNQLVSATLVQQAAAVPANNASFGTFSNTPSTMILEATPAKKYDRKPLLESRKFLFFLLLIVVVLFVGVATLVVSAVKGMTNGKENSVVQNPVNNVFSSNSTDDDEPTRSPTQDVAGPPTPAGAQIPTPDPAVAPSGPNPTKPDPPLNDDRTPPTPQPTTPTPTFSPTSQPSHSPVENTLPPSTDPPTARAIEELIYDTLFQELPIQSIEAIARDDSPQAQAVQWLLQDEYFRNHRRRILQPEDLPSRIKQRFTLATLYFSTNGENWNNNLSWLSSDHECNWYSSVAPPSCQGDDLVQLVLSGNGLSGRLPHEVNLLQNLEKLDLSNNSLAGNISTGTLGPLEKLRILKLDTNQLDGTLLTEIGNLESLISLKLGNNNFVGELPEEWSALSRINTLWIENNPGITGTVPTSYGNLESLEHLWLHGTSLEGVFPDSVCQLPALQPPMVQCASLNCNCCICQEPITPSPSIAAYAGMPSEDEDDDEDDDEHEDD